MISSPGQGCITPKRAAWCCSMPTCPMSQVLGQRFGRAHTQTRRTHLARGAGAGCRPPACSLHRCPRPPLPLGPFHSRQPPAASPAPAGRRRADCSGRQRQVPAGPPGPGESSGPSTASSPCARTPATRRRTRKPSLRRCQNRGRKHPARPLSGSAGGYQSTEGHGDLEGEKRSAGGWFLGLTLLHKAPPQVSRGCVCAYGKAQLRGARASEIAVVMVCADKVRADIPIQFQL